MTMINGEEWVGETAGSATWVALVIVLCCYVARLLLRRKLTVSFFFTDKSSGSAGSGDTVQPQESRNQISITDDDLRKLIKILDGRVEDGEPKWEPGVNKISDTVSYTSLRRDPKDGGPTQYLSTTVFENCTSELARDFYMDSDYRAQWDKALLQSQQLEISQDTGIEVGRSVKKFPFLTPREYVLVWRVWEGRDKTFYCFIKGCDHHLAIRQPNCKRVEVYYSGWRIRNVPGRNACQITMIHQEDLAMRRDMEKMAYSRGIWSFVVRSETHLRRYALRHPCLHLSPNAVSLAQKLPADLEESILQQQSSAQDSPCVPSTQGRSKKQLAKKLLLVGGVMIVMRSSSSIGARLAAACIVNRVMRPRESLNSLRRRPRT